MATRPPRKSEDGYILSTGMTGKLVANEERVFFLGPEEDQGSRRLGKGAD